METKDDINYIGDKTIGRTFEKTHQNANKLKTLQASATRQQMAFSISGTPIYI